MSRVEGILFWASMGLYFLRFILYLVHSVFGKESRGAQAWRLFDLAFILQTATIAWRWYLSGRPPVMVSYEHYQLAAWFTAVSIIGGVAFYPRLKVLPMAAAAVVLPGLRSCCRIRRRACGFRPRRSR